MATDWIEGELDADDRDQLMGERELTPDERRVVDKALKRSVETIEDPRIATARSEGRKEGLEEAARWHEAVAIRLLDAGRPGMAGRHTANADSIRALIEREEQG